LIADIDAAIRRAQIGIRAPSYGPNGGVADTFVRTASRMTPISVTPMPKAARKAAKSVARGSTHYGRTDALVVYVGQRYFPMVARVVAQMRDKVPLEASTPLFTKTLWPGIGAAIEPGNGESFGSHRSRLTAEGIVDAWREGAQESGARIAAIEPGELTSRLRYHERARM
jgi:hypothetical protein